MWIAGDRHNCWLVALCAKQNALYTRGHLSVWLDRMKLLKKTSFLTFMIFATSVFPASTSASDVVNMRAISQMDIGQNIIKCVCSVCSGLVLIDLQSHHRLKSAYIDVYCSRKQLWHTATTFTKTGREGQARKEEHVMLRQNGSVGGVGAGRVALRHLNRSRCQNSCCFEGEVGRKTESSSHVRMRTWAGAWLVRL